MDFALEETAQAVRDLAAEVLRREGALDPAADTAAEVTRYHEHVWKALAEADLLSLALPERLGGAGLGALEVGVLLGEVGRYAAQVPALSTLAFGVLPLLRLGDTAQQDRVLPAVGAGQVLTAAVNEVSRPLPDLPRTVGRREGDGVVVTGTKTGVLYAETAHRLLVTLRFEDGPGVVMVEPGASGVHLRPQRTSAGTPAWTVHLDGVRISAADVLGVGVQAVDEMHDCVLAGICAVGGGALAGAADLTAEHLRTRTQFGRPLATFQAVAQQIADVYVTSRTMNLATLSALWRLSRGLDAGEDIAVAAFWLAEEVPPATQTCHHLHGGLGVDVTYPMHRYYSLIKDLSALVGGGHAAVDRLAKV